MYPGIPEKQGLYDPQFEHDSCGVGFIVDMHGRKSHTIVRKAIQVLVNLQHRGAKGCEVNTGDGAGITIFYAAPIQFLMDFSPPSRGFQAGAITMRRRPSHQDVTMPRCDPNARPARLRFKPFVISVCFRG